jgi:hypothetical protein
MSGFPVHCKNGHPLKDVYDLPCPTCACQEAIVSMSARSQAMASAGATGDAT